MYQAMYAKVADSLRQTDQFREPEQWRFDWEQPDTRAQWQDLLPTTGGLTQLPPDQLTEILDAVGRAIDSDRAGLPIPATRIHNVCERREPRG